MRVPSPVRDLTSFMPQKNRMRSEFPRPGTKSPMAQPSLPFQFHPPCAPLSPTTRLRGASSEFQRSAAVPSFAFARALPQVSGSCPGFYTEASSHHSERSARTPSKVRCAAPPATPAEEAPGFCLPPSFSPLQTYLKFSCSVLFLLLVCPLTGTIRDTCPATRPQSLGGSFLTRAGFPVATRLPQSVDPLSPGQRRTAGDVRGPPRPRPETDTHPSAPVSMTKATQSCVGIRERDHPPPSSPLRGQYPSLCSVHARGSVLRG